MADKTCLAIVLAAGEGTRMRASRPKALHQIGGRSLLAHVLEAVRAAGGTDVAVVVGPQAEAVQAEAERSVPSAGVFVQSEQCGTAHAVLAAREALARTPDEVLVIFADTPLVRPQTLLRMRAALAEGAAVAVLGFRPQDPTGYGRLIVENG
jgi:bifunctional UDP-N-acetylglucosamine pyrophosphorylase/glucosamine-1-phosphate N-acetyltransferase